MTELYINFFWHVINKEKNYIENYIIEKKNF